MMRSEAEPRLGGENRASGFGPILLALCLAAGAGHGQWVEDSIDVGGSWVGSLVYNSRADVVYGRSGSGDLFFTISCDSNKVIAQLELNDPGCLAYSTTSNKAYCVFRDGGEDSVLVVDGETHTRIGAIPLEGAKRPIWDAAVNRLYVSCDDRYVAVINCVTDSVLCRIRVGSSPNGLDINDQYRKLYVRNWDGESVSIIDMESLEVIETIRLDGVPKAGCYSTAVDKYYCGGGNEVVVIDGVGDSVVAEIALPQGTSVWSMTENPRDSLVLLGVEDGLSLHALYSVDAVADTVVSVLPINRGPQGLLWSPATDLVYCANYDGIVTVIAGDGSRVRKTIPVGQSPFVFAYAPTHDRVYLGHLSSRMVYVIRDTTSGIAEHANLAATPVSALRAFPNPFVRRVTCECVLPVASRTEIRVYSQEGSLVRRLPAGPGRQRFAWNGRDELDREVPPGVYFFCSDGLPSSRVRLVKLGAGRE